MPKNHVGPMAPKNVKTQLYGYDNWVSIKIVNHEQSRDSIVIKRVTLDYGQVYETGNKDKAISPNDINGQVIAPGQSYTVNSSGKWRAMNGTSGSFDIVEVGTEALVGKTTWIVPNRGPREPYKAVRFNKAKNAWGSYMTGWNNNPKQLELGEGTLTLKKEWK